MNKQSNLPILITPGDAAGIGPEVALKATSELHDAYPFLFVGPEWLWRSAGARFSLPVQAEFLDVPALSDMAPQPVIFGEVSATWGRVAMECVRVAAQACLDGSAAAVVTAPLTKAGIHAAGYAYRGHTDFLADITHTKRHAMMLSCGALRVLLVTHHQSISSVPESLTVSEICEKIELAHEAGGRLNIEAPRIAVCGLNPHAGEAGAFGDEERTVIAPAIDMARGKGINVSGPYPSDTVFHRALEGEFDFVVAMYHDQGLIPVKLHGFDQGVNTTLGLPIVRTSPDHGSAYDIAGRGTARATSMKAAIRMAAGLCG